MSHYDYSFIDIWLAGVPKTSAKTEHWSWLTDRSILKVWFMTSHQDQFTNIERTQWSMIERGCWMIQLESKIKFEEMRDRWLTEVTHAGLSLKVSVTQ